VSSKNISILSTYQTPIRDSTGKLYFIFLLETMNNIGMHRKASNTRHFVKTHVWVKIWFKLCIILQLCIKRFSFTIKLSNTIKFNYLKNYCCTLNSKILLPDWFFASINVKQEPVGTGLCSPNKYWTQRSSLSKVVVKSDFKSQSYVPETILLKGHTVTLTFKVATQLLYATRRLNMVIIYMK